MKKGSIVIAFLILVLLFGGSIVYLVGITSQNTQLSNQQTQINEFEEKYDLAISSISTTVDASFNLALKKFLQNGYSNNSYLWVEDGPFVPDKNEIKTSLKKILNDSLQEGFQVLYIENPELSSDKFEINLDDMNIELIEEQFTDDNGNERTGYRIKLKGITLTTEEPKTEKTFNFDYFNKDMWIIYEEVKDYINQETINFFDELSDLTYYDVCSDAACKCNSPLPSFDNSGIINSYIFKEDIIPIFNNFFEKLKNKLDNQGINCDYKFLTLNTENRDYKYIIFQGTQTQVCRTTSYPSARTPRELAIWNDFESKPKGLLPYAKNIVGVYDYDGEGFSRLPSTGIANLLVNLKENRNPSPNIYFQAASGIPSLIFNKLYRGIKGLINFKCTIPSVMIMGGDPSNPSKVDLLKSNIGFRINTWAKCPDPIDTPRPEIIEGSLTCNAVCWMEECNPADPTQTHCVPDDSEIPTDEHPCDKIITETFSANDPLRDQLNGAVASAWCSCQAQRPNPECGTDPDTDEVCAPETETYTPDTCTINGNTCNQGEVLAYTWTGTAGEYQQATHQDCPKVEPKCSNGQPTCSCMSCFLPGTKITMANGELKNIEDVKIGDKILSYNFKTKEFEEDKVCKTEAVKRCEYYEIYLKDGRIIKITNEHPLYSRYKSFEGWASIRLDVATIPKINPIKLNESFQIFTKNKTWIDIVKIKLINKTTNVYNLNCVMKNHNFLADGILAHNEANKGVPDHAAGDVSTIDTSTPPIDPRDI